MWFESQHCAMMGVQVTAGKRKLETAATAGGDICPAKTGRWEPPAGGGGGAGTGAGTANGINGLTSTATSPSTLTSTSSDDCIARLQAVAVPGDAWRPTPAATPPPAPLAATLLAADDFDDDDDFDEELSDDDRCSGAPRYAPLTAYDYPPHSPHSPLPHAHTHSPTHTQQTAPQLVRSAYGGAWHYYAPPVQQTIRCEENGKSYLELGAAPPAPPAAATVAAARARCCDGRTRWCNVPCYRQRRLAVLNLSMCKLARYRQCSDPSLRRSVLICNTLRHIEREMEAEGQQPPLAPPSPHLHHHPPPPEPPCYSPSAAFTECTPLTPLSPQPQRLLTPHPQHPQQQQPAPHMHPPPQMPPLDPYEHNLRDFASPSGRATPFPIAPVDSDSGIGDDDAGRSINWGSVLSLTSQTDLEPLNNNELYAELGLSSAPTDLDWKEPRPDGEWDSFMHVLVGGS